MRDILKLGIILMVYSLVAGASLAYVNILTREQITTNQTEAENAARAEVLPGMAGGYELKGQMEVDGYQYPWWIGYKDQAKTTPGGYVFIASGKGYSSVIRTMVGVSPDGKIIGIKVIFQQETPGLGTKYVEKRYGEKDYWFYRQFAGKSAEDNLRVKKDGGAVDALTGATVTPRAITDSINKGMVALQKAAGGKS